MATPTTNWRAAANNRKRKAESNGGGDRDRWPPFDVARFSLDPSSPIEQDQSALVIIPEGAAPYSRYTHWPRGQYEVDGVKKSRSQDECTGDANLYPEFGGKCVYCYHDALVIEHRKTVDAQNRLLKEAGASPMQRPDRPFYPRETVDMLLLDLRVFHYAPDPKNPDRYNTVACQNPEQDADETCTWCKHPDAYVNKRRTDHTRRFLEGINKDNLAVLDKLIDLSNNTCLAKLPDGSFCMSPTEVRDLHCVDCGHVYYGLEALKDQSRREEIQAAMSEDRECPDCGKTAPPEPGYRCRRAHKDARAEAQAAGLPTKGVKPKHEAVPALPHQLVWRVTATAVTQKIQSGPDKGKNRTSTQFHFTPAEEALQIPFLTNPKEALRRMLPGGNASDELLATLLTAPDMTKRYTPGSRLRVNKNSDDFKDADGKFKEAAWVASVLDAQARNCGEPNPFTGTGADAGTRSWTPNKRFGGADPEDDDE